MKSFKHSQEEGFEARVELLRLIKQLMTGGEGYHATFDRVKLDGSNVGAEMCVSPSASAGVPDSCGITIFISNNIQGVNNSILVGSEVKMVEPGMKLSFGDTLREKDRHKFDSAIVLPWCWLAAILLCAVAILVSVSVTTS